MKSATQIQKAATKAIKGNSKSAGPVQVALPDWAMQTVQQEGTFKGKPMFEVHDPVRLRNGDEYSAIVTMGLRKATAILAHVDQLRAFVASHQSEE